MHTWLKTFQPLTFSQLLENECFHPEKVAYHWVSFPCCLLSYALSFSITLDWPFLGGVACDQTGGSHCQWDFKMKLRCVTGMCQSWQVHPLALHGDSSRKTMAALLCLPRPPLQLCGQTAWQRLCQPGTREPPEEGSLGFLWARCTTWQPTTGSFCYALRWPSQTAANGGLKTV